MLYSCGTELDGADFLRLRVSQKERNAAPFHGFTVLEYDSAAFEFYTAVESS